MKAKKVRQLATPNTRLRLPGSKYLLLSVCFVSSLHQFLRSHFRDLRFLRENALGQTEVFPHKNEVVDGGPNSLLGPDVPIAQKIGSFRQFSVENRSAKRKLFLVQTVFTVSGVFLEDPTESVTHLWVKNLRTATR